jgi:hypothetical protein
VTWRERARRARYRRALRIVFPQHELDFENKDVLATVIQLDLLDFVDDDHSTVAWFAAQKVKDLVRDAVLLKLASLQADSELGDSDA